MPEIRYDKLYEQLKRMILDGTFRNKLPGIHKLAKQLGANHITVRKAVEMLIEQGRLEVIPRCGTFIRKKEEPARNFHVIGCIGLRCCHGIRELVINRANERLQSRGYRILDITATTTIFMENPNLLLQFPVDGYIFFGSSLTRSIMQLLLDNRIPLISSINSNFPEINHVGMDYFTAYADALKALKKLGCRRIAFYDHSRHSDFQNYIDDIRNIFIRELGPDFEPDLFSLYSPGDYFQKFGQDCVPAAAKDFIRSWKGVPPDGLITVPEVVPVFRQLAPSVRTVSFVTFGTPCESDVVMYEDLPSLLNAAAERMLELLAGDTNLTETVISFIQKKLCP